MSTKPEFGVSSSSRGRGGRFLGSTRANKSFQKFGLPTSNTNDPTNIDQRFEDAQRLDGIEDRFGFERYQEGPERLGWLLNMHAVSKVSLLL
jgi:DNA polymerase epsilon subunit 1